MLFECPDDSWFPGKAFTLEFTFYGDYPLKCPFVKFVGGSFPQNTNVNKWGFIDRKVLESEWTHKISIADCCMKIIEMISYEGKNRKQVKG